jgi:DNA processing protein
VVSGLARGIDTEVHLGAGASSTIAVLAGGVDVCYPKQNQSLYDAIAQNGCIISEMPMGQAPARHLFHQRNRIIAAMAKATCVIEARRQSGSLITANFALEYGRDVFSAPGNPLEEHSKGCHDLLRQGALLMDDATDVMDVIGKVKNPNENLDQKLTSSTNSKTLSFLQQSSSPFKVHYQGLFDLLSFTPIAVEVIQQTTRMDLELLLHCLSELEMQSLIVRQGDQVYLNPS